MMIHLIDYLLGAFCLLFALFTLYIKFLVAKSGDKGVPMLDGYVIPPSLIAIAAFSINREKHYSFWHFIVIWVCALVVTAVILHVGQILGKKRE